MLKVIVEQKNKTKTKTEGMAILEIKWPSILLGLRLPSIFMGQNHAKICCPHL